jgi:HK97 gp10 family phage protein
MSDTMHVQGVDKLVAKLKKLDGLTPEILGKALFAGALVLETNVKLSMQEPKHGRTYARTKSGKSHTASAPGEAPAIDFGALINSLHARLVSGLSGPEAEVFTNAEYGKALEFGTSKMRARPFMRPAADKREPILEAVRVVASRLIEEAAK